MMTREAASTLPDGHDGYRFSVSSSPPVEAAIDTVLVHGIDAAFSRGDDAGTEGILSRQTESCSDITENVNGGVENEGALPQKAGSAMDKDTEGDSRSTTQMNHEVKSVLPSEVQNNEEKQDSPPSVQINRATEESEKRESAGPLRVCIKPPSEDQETADARQEEKRTEKSPGGPESIKETDEKDAEVDAEEEDEFDLDKQRRRKSYRQYFGLDGPEEDDEDDEEEDELDLDKQRRRKSYLEYFGLVGPTEGKGQGGEGGLSAATSPGAHRRSSLVSIMFDAGRVTHWSDVYQKDKQAQPVVFKRMDLRFEVVNTDGGLPGILGTREVWLAVYDHGRAAYGPLLFDCSEWAMVDRVAVVKKAKKELIFKRPEKSQTETAKVYPIFVDVLENRYIRLPRDLVTKLYENCP
ncbi:hypothetical protein CSUI_005697 [Cystoisospora suis]|uniref:Uncharacterized protein n=1 Tax=Cystoisospora suis TaxID=483139 RepID=A0A2C6KUB1_9APIC|nr:hypothetical protein CSUI_005697 [Cystoisospora suis]